MMPTETGSYPFDVAILIVSFNTRDVLRRCLESVYRESVGLNLQVIVVDNCSRDGSVQMVREEFPQVQMVESPANLGFGCANNLGFKLARGRYLVLLNSDAFLTAGALQTSIRHMDENPQVGLGGARLVCTDHSWQPSARMFPNLLNELMVMSGVAAKYPRSRLFGRMDRTWASAMEPAEVDWVPGAYSIIRTEALNTIGLFDPIFFLYYEEVDLCRRIKEAGYSIYYWPDVLVIHVGGESSRQVEGLELSESGAQLTLWRMRSTLLYYRKHHGMTAATVMLMEICWYRIQAMRKLRSKDPVRKGWGRTEARLAALMWQAWQETKGGTVSPAQPW